MDMDQLLAFVQERWFVIIIALLVLVVVVKIVKTFVKWVIVLAIIGGLLYYGANYNDELRELGDTVANSAKEQAVRLMQSGASNAEYEVRPDGSYTVKSQQLTLSGRIGSSEVTVEYRGFSFQMESNEYVEAFIEQARSNTQN